MAKEIPPLMDCGVGLLIGYDCSRALIPRKVITGGDYEPYAIKTDLGWSIVGSVPQCVNAKDVTGLRHRVSVRELPHGTPSSIIKALESDFADNKSGDKSISQEDICFLQILKESSKTSLATWRCLFPLKYILTYQITRSWLWLG